MQAHAALVLAGIAVLGILCQWLAWWVKLPAILFLLLAGILAGPVTGWLDPDALFGGLLFPFVSLAVAVILFEGSLTLKLSEIRGLETVVRRMVTSGLLLTWVVIAAVTRWLLAFPVELAVLFGAFMVVTGPTVIVPMLRTVRPTRHIASILRWEGIVIDPIGALLAVLVFEFVLVGQGGTAWGHTLASLARLFGVGLLLGALGGQALGLALRRHWLPEYLQSVAALALVLGLFAASNALEEESGLLTVTVMGLWLANMRGVSVEHILDFKESLSLMLISGLFIVLAARIDFAQLRQLGWAALGVFAAVQFIARPLKVALATLGSSLGWRERALLAWIAPRGIVAAAVAALFALKLEAAGYAQAGLLVPLTFLVIIGTVVLQSATAGRLARLLGVAEPEPSGFLIVGANPVARTVAAALKEAGYDSLLCDTSWSHVRAARMHGLNGFYGSAVSEYADRRLDLVGLGRLLALSPQPEINALAVHRYRREFGDHQVYTLAPEPEGDSKQVAAPPAGHIAFARYVTYQRMARALSLGAEVKETPLSESFDLDAYRRQYYRRAIPLFALDPKGGLHLFRVDHEIEPGPEWRLVALIEPEPEETGPLIEKGVRGAADDAPGETSGAAGRVQDGGGNSLVEEAG